MASEENIKVGVRLRPFLPNLKKEANGRSKRVVLMDDISSAISIQNPQDLGDVHKFVFDSVMWSFDGYSEQADGYMAPDNKVVSEEIYCDQKQVYEEVGKEMVQNLWNGVNGTISTLGEGRSGKSWTLLGIGVNKGIVPQSLSDLFKGVRDKEKNGGTIEVRLSMAEIINDRVKDLLPALSPSSKFKSAAKIREHSRKGFYIEGLRNVLVINHDDIQQRLEEGLLNRAVFLTGINATSGYSTTFIAITLVQRIRNQRGDEVTRMATLEFFDLPACELKAGEVKEDESDGKFGLEDYDFDDSSTNCVMITENLKRNGMECLSNCVDSMIEASIGKFTDTIPFYKQSFTKLLRNAFLGNTKTYLVVTLSPSEESFKNSLFVLKLAEKIRMLTTRSGPNEEVTSKLIRELKSENDKIRKLISLGEIETNVDLSNRFARASLMNPSEREGIKRKIVEDMKGQIRENEKEIRNLQQNFDERLKPFKNEKNDLGKKIENDRKSKSHIYNLHRDAQVCGKIIHIIPLGSIDFGQSCGSSKGKENGHFISFTGPGILDHHGSFSYNSKDGKFSLRPSGPNAKISVNGRLIQFDTILGHNDIIVLGGNQIWVYQNPKETWLEKISIQDKIYYENVLEEVALNLDDYRKLNSKENLCELLQDELVELIPSLEDARAMVTDLKQSFVIEPVIQYPVEVLLKDNGNCALAMSSSSSVSSAVSVPKILIKVQNTADGSFHYWPTTKFHERLEMLRDSYTQYLEDGDVPLKEIAAFKERLDVDMPIGYSIICLEPLAYMINIVTPAPILDYITFEVIGSISVSLNFCEEAGSRMNDAEIFINSPDELVDKHLTILMSLEDMKTVVLKYKDIYCKYEFLEEDEDMTKYLDTKSTNFTSGVPKFEKKFSVDPVTDNIINLMLTQNLILKFYGKQRAHKLLNLGMGNIKEANLGDEIFTSNPVQLERTKAQLKIKEVAEQRKQRRLNAMQALVTQSESLGEEAIPVNIVKTLFEAKSQKLVDQSLEEYKESLTLVPEPPQEKQLPPELKALKRFSEVCAII